MAADDVIHIEVQGSLNAGLWQQSFYYKITSDAADPINNEIEACKAWEAIVAPVMQAAVSDELAIDCATGQKVFPLPVGNTFIEPFEALPGLLNGESLPATNAAVITTLTAVASRTTRGRKYVPGIREADQQGGRVVMAEHALLLALGAAYVSAISFDAFAADPVIAHRDPATPFAVLSTEDVIASNVRPRLGNQRRRRTFRTNISV